MFRLSFVAIFISLVALNAVSAHPAPLAKRNVIYTCVSLRKGERCLSGDDACCHVVCERTDIPTNCFAIPSTQSIPFCAHARASRQVRRPTQETGPAQAQSSPASPTTNRASYSTTSRSDASSPTGRSDPASPTGRSDPASPTTPKPDRRIDVASRSDLLRAATTWSGVCPASVSAGSRAL
ncbi:hypothetical protein PTTG_02533, partial [Puccinia triticina 1-1 BBBD Race 1]